MSWEAIAGFCSAVIALCALGFTFWQGYITRQHNKLSVTPFLTTWRHSNVVENTFALDLLNNGIGPAFIQSFEIYVDGQKMVGESYEPIAKALKLLFPQYRHVSHQCYLGPGYSMAPKESRSLVIVQFVGPTIPALEEVEHVIKRARLIIKYTSIYKDEYTYDSEANRNAQLAMESQRLAA